MSISMKKYKYVRQHYIKQILLALHYCHSNMIAHLDVKPENMVVFSDGTLKMIDFGSSVFFHPCISEEYNIHTTYAYSPPELLDSESEHNISYPAIDIWSLGMTLVYLLTDDKLDIFKETRKNPVLYEINKIYSNGDWTNILDDVDEDELDFLSCCVKYNPKERLSSYQLLLHKYLN